MCVCMSADVNKIKLERLNGLVSFFSGIKGFVQIV